MGQVVFRRIHGRLVPIKVDRTEVAKGVGAMAGGIGIAHATAEITSRMTHASALAENAAREAVKPARLLFKSKALERGAFAVRGGGTALAAAALGIGIHKALSQTRLQEHENLKVAASTAGTTAAVFAVQSVYYRRLGNFWGHAISAAARRALSRGK